MFGQLGQQLQEQLQEFNSQFTTQVQQKLEELKQSAGNEQHKTQFDIWLNQELKTPQLGQQLQEQFSALQTQQIIGQAELQQPLEQLQGAMQQLVQHVYGQQGVQIEQAVLGLLYDTATQFSGQEVEEGATVKLTFADMNQEEQSIYLKKQNEQVQVVEQAEDVAEVDIKQLQAQCMEQQITEVQQYIEQQVWQYLTDKAEVLRVGQEAVDVPRDVNNQLASQYNQLAQNFKQKYPEPPFAQALQLANPGLMGNGMPEQLPYQLFGESDKYGGGTSIENAENMLQKLSGQYGNVQGVIIWNVDNKYVLIVDALPSDMQKRTIYLGIQPLKSGDCVPLTLGVIKNIASGFTEQTLYVQAVKLDNGVWHVQLGITSFENSQQQQLAAQYISGQYSPLNENGALLTQAIADRSSLSVNSISTGSQEGNLDFAIVPVRGANPSYGSTQSSFSNSGFFQWMVDKFYSVMENYLQNQNEKELKSIAAKCDVKTDHMSSKAIYRKLALELHPDKGGAAEMFKTVNEINNKLTKGFNKDSVDQYIANKLSKITNIAHKGVVALKTVDSAVDVWKLWNEPTAENTLTIGLDAGHLYSLSGMPKAGWVSVGTSALPISYALYQEKYQDAGIMAATTAAYLAIPYALAAIPGCWSGYYNYIYSWYDRVCRVSYSK